MNFNHAVLLVIYFCVTIILFGDYKQEEKVESQIIQPSLVKKIEAPKPKDIEKKQKEVKQLVAQELVEVDQYSPRWNVEGSIKKAESKTDLIKHLSGNNHRHSIDYLNQLSTDDLQRLHDADHDNRKNITHTQSRFRLFRR